MSYGFNYDFAHARLDPAAELRLRRKNGTKWDRATVRVEPRSAYLLSAEARDVWEHSIPPVDAIRYSVTFRTFREITST